MTFLFHSMHSSWDSEPISRAMTSSSILLSELRTYTHNARWSPPVCPAYTRHLRTARGSLLQRPADPPTPTSLLKPETLPLASLPLSNAFPVLSQWLSHLARTLSPRASPGGFSPRSPAPPTSRVGPSPRSVVPTILQGPPLPFGTNSAFLCPLPPVKAKSSATV